MFFFASSICFVSYSDVILSRKEASPMFLLLFDEYGDFFGSHNLLSERKNLWAALSYAVFSGLKTETSNDCSK